MAQQRLKRGLSALGMKREVGPLASVLLFWVPVVFLCGFMYTTLMNRFRALPPDLSDGSRDIQTYQMAGENILSGAVPYRDFFIEYPPGSLPFFVPPAAFSEATASYATYFAAEMALLLVASLVLTALSARALGLPWLLAAGALVAAAVLLNPIAVTRYDAVVALTVAVAVALAVRSGRGGALSSLALTGAWISLGVGAAAKLVPALVGPPLALFAARLGGWREFVRGSAVFAFVVAAFFVPAVVLGGGGFLRSFAYHAERGLQIESVAASILMKLGYAEGTVFEFGAFDVAGPGTEFWSSMSLPITGALVVVTAAMMYREHLAGTFSGTALPRYGAAFVLAFMVGSKVLSPQYMIWLLPLIPLCAGGLWLLGAAGLYLGGCWATSQIFPENYGSLLSLDGPAVNLLLERNLILVVLWILMLVLPSAGAEVKKTAAHRNSGAVAP